MSMTTIFQCPVSNARKAVSSDVDDAPIDAPVFVEIDEDDEDGPTLPEGWGSLTLQRVVANPDYAAVIEEREKILAAFDADVAKGLEGVDASQRPLVIQGLDQTHPVPPQTVYQRVEYNVLSPEAFAVAFAAIKAAFMPESA